MISWGHAPPGQAGVSGAVDLETERVAVWQAGMSAAGGQPGGTFAGREARRPAPHWNYVE